MEETALLLTMMSIMLTAGICSVVFNKMKLPPIIGYLLAGILIVNVFNFKNAEQFSVDAVEVLKDLGLVMLMFGIGIELNIEKIRKYGKLATLVAIIQLPLMVLNGYAFGMILFNLNVTAALTLGAIISGSSTAVVTAILKAQWRISKNMADTIILVTIIEDIGQVLILSMITPIFIGSQVNVVDLLRLTITIVMFMVASLYIGIKFVPKILNWVGDNTSAEVLLVLSIGLCFTMAWLSTLIEMSMAIGAFLTGVMVSQSNFSKHITEKIEPMKEVFMAVFFISVGMDVTFQGFVNNLPMAFGILIVFMISKFCTVFLGYFIGNREFEEGFVSSVLLLAMGEFALIISSEAYKSGIVTEGFYTSVIGAALMSMIVLPIVSKVVYKVTDGIIDGTNSRIRYFMSGFYSVRNDIYNKIEALPHINDIIKRNLKNTYVCVILIIIIEIVFSGLMTPMTNFVADIMDFKGFDNHRIAYIELMIVNFFLLVIPTYWPIKSIKFIDKLLVEGEKYLSRNTSYENKEKVMSIYYTVMNFSTLALIFTIDFIIMAVVPGPFGAEKSSLVVIPMALVIFVIGYIFSKKKRRKQITW